MQVTLPVGQPVERHTIGLAFIALAGIAATPLDLELVMGTKQVTQVSSTNMILNQISTSGVRGLQPGLNTQLFTEASLVTKPLDIASNEIWKEKFLKKKKILADRRLSLIENNQTAQIQSAKLVAVTDNNIAVAKLVDPVTIKDSPEEISAAGESLGKKVIALAMTWEGTPYLWGGQSRLGIDCSALVQTIYAEVGVKLPRVTYDQFRQGIGVAQSKLIPGDLVFFSTNGPGASHVGIYIGDEKFISATRHKVEVQKITDAYWRKTYRGSRRILL